MGKINFIINNALDVSSKRGIKKAFIMFLISVMAFVPAVLFTACSKKESKETVSEEKPEYVYDASFKELGNIKMDSIGKSCFNLL